jgi:hypothetical protein
MSRYAQLGVRFLYSWTFTIIIMIAVIVWSLAAYCVLYLNSVLRAELQPLTGVVVAVVAHRIYHIWYRIFGEEDEIYVPARTIVSMVETIQARERQHQQRQQQQHQQEHRNFTGNIRLGHNTQGPIVMPGFGLTDRTNISPTFLQMLSISGQLRPQPSETNTNLSDSSDSSDSSEDEMPPLGYINTITSNGNIETTGNEAAAARAQIIHAINSARADNTRAAEMRQLRENVQTERMQMRRDIAADRANDEQRIMVDYMIRQMMDRPEGPQITSSNVPQ